MCLAVPSRVVEAVDEGEALVELSGNRVTVSTVLLDRALPGDWLLVHAGFAIQRLEAEDAEALFGVLGDLRAAHQSVVGQTAKAEGTA